MVKKVIDIIPPQNWPAKRATALLSQDGELPTGAVLPQELPQEDYRSDLPPAMQEPIQAEKPRIVYGSQKYDGDTIAAEVSQDGRGGFWMGLFVKLGIAAAVILLAMYGMDAKFAKAVVKIWPETSILQKDLKVVVDPSIGDINKDKKAIPGFAISVEKVLTGDAPVAGRKDAQGKALGTVKIFNNYTTAQRLVKGTRLQAPLEKFQPALAGDETPWFRTVEDVVLGPKSTATVKVAADVSGEKYNIDPSVFSVPGLVGTAQYTFIYGQSFEKFAGGSLDSVPEVKKEDLENAKIAIENSAKEQIKKELEAKVSAQGLEIVDASVEKFEFGKAEITAKAGDSIAKIGGQIGAKASTVAYKKSDLESLGKDFIIGQIPYGNIADESSVAIKSSYAGIDTASGRPSLAISAQATIYPGMGQDDLKKGLSEKGGNEAKIYLMNQPGTKEVKIQLTPPWRFSIPRDLDRIEIQTILD